MGISRSAYYNQPVVLSTRDQQAVTVLLAAHAQHPLYGVRRLALHLGWSENKARRIRTLAGVHIVRPSKKKRYGRSNPAEILAAPNALKRFAHYRNAARPQDGMNYAGMVDSGGWVQDFTYLWFQRSWHYLAVVLDLKTRQVVGWKLGLRHSSELTHAALLEALGKYPSPSILHSDQGSEYLSYKHQLTCDQYEITLSCSNKSSPWQNGFMERFFGSFKPELGKLAHYQDIGQLVEAIALTVHYYNHDRIHLALGMSPAAYAATLTGE
ncbi:MAG TPA: IS3 family transposase [Candidatus Dormibacteraeota bacterium]|nr:IS3 family transposase [Candidatus Dormibacteraeota bacterium]